ncbi:MAG: ABC transporter ATP-binding protein [SAR324 cluster bacterium]|nr:ABC transporter ATP-binding protein [SAR324 cluster bacterium]
MTQPLLKVTDLKTQFRTKWGLVKAVDGVSFHVKHGETFGIVGESGSGKSVTSLSIMRLIPQPAGRIVSGAIELDGLNLLELSEKEMRDYRGGKIGMILQDPLSSLNPLFTIGSQIIEGLRIHTSLKGRSLKERAIDLLRRVHIPSPAMRMKDWPHLLSGGMRQRVVGAISISCEPELLIADEPTTALDATIQLQYLNLLKRIQKETRLSIIFVTHDLGAVAYLCHRAAVMYAGRIVETATVKDLFDKPAHPYTIGLLNSMQKVEKKADHIESIKGQPPNLKNLPIGCSFAPRCDQVKDICKEKYPEETELGADHLVRCWVVKKEAVKIK